MRNLGFESITNESYKKEKTKIVITVNVIGIVLLTGGLTCVGYGGYQVFAKKKYTLLNFGLFGIGVITSTIGILMLVLNYQIKNYFLKLKLNKKISNKILSINGFINKIEKLNKTNIFSVEQHATELFILHFVLKKKVFHFLVNRMNHEQLQFLTKKYIEIGNLPDLIALISFKV